MDSVLQSLNKNLLMQFVKLNTEIRANINYSKNNYGGKIVWLCPCLISPSDETACRAVFMHLCNIPKVEFYRKTLIKSKLFNIIYK